jgi:hypothetical protein
VFESDDPDWAPQLPSIWDTHDPEDEDQSLDDPLSPPITMAMPAPDWLDPAAWIMAEAGAGRALATAAEAVGRLDERLRRVPEALRLAWRQRLALEDVSVLLWAEGVRVRPETLALADADRIGRAEDEDHVVARAAWARRRLLGQGSLPTAGEDLPVFLGRAALAQDAGGDGWRDVPEGLIPAGPGPRACDAWCAAMAALGDAHPLTRSAAGFHLWRGLGLSGPGAWLEPGVVAARLAGQSARGGFASAVLCAGSERALARPGGDAAARLGMWLSGLAEAVEHAQMTLDRIEAWQARAHDHASGLKGKGAPALIALLAARPVISAKDAATELDLSPVQARTLLNRLHALGLTRELTGHTRFRFWTARV